jgi:hypothetical protein
MTTRKFQIGDRVRIRMSEANGFLLPLRKFAHEGRDGTVIDGPIISSGSVLVRFDTKRPPKRESDYHFRIRPRELELVEEGSTHDHP